MGIIKYLMVFFILTGIAYAEDTAVKQKVYTATVDKDGVQRVEITGGEYYFDPNYIIVKKDIPVEFIVKKTPGITPHNIVIESPEAGINIRESMSTDPKVIRFTPAKAGRYPVFCDKKLLFFPSHRKKGMEGILEVVE
jgi:plastocyanin